MFVDYQYQRRYEDFRKDEKMRLGAILKAFEALPHEVYKAYNFKGFRISYKMAAKPHEDLVCKYAFVEDKHVCCIFDKDGGLKTQVEFY